MAACLVRVATFDKLTGNRCYPNLALAAAVGATKALGSPFLLCRSLRAVLYVGVTLFLAHFASFFPFGGLFFLFVETRSLNEWAGLALFQ